MKLRAGQSPQLAVDHGGDESIAIKFKIHDLIPQIHGGEPHNGLTMACADNLIALVHFPRSFLDSIIHEVLGSVNTFFIRP